MCAVKSHSGCFLPLNSNTTELIDRLLVGSLLLSCSVNEMGKTEEEEELRKADCPKCLSDWIQNTNKPD